MSSQHTTTQNNLSSKRDALQRVAQLETVIFGGLDADGKPTVGAIESLSKNADNTQRQLSGIVEIVDAVVRALGVETIERLVTEGRVEQARKEATEQQERLAELLKQGTLKPSTVIGDNSFVVGQESTPDGKVIEPGWFMHHMSQIKPSAQEGLKGKEVGFALTTEVGNTYLVKEVYELVPPGEQVAVEAPAEGLKVDSTVELMPPSLVSTPPQE